MCGLGVAGCGSVLAALGLRAGTVMVVDVRVVPFSSEAHEVALAAVLGRMRGAPYPGPRAGQTPVELLRWLGSVPMLCRFVAVSDSGVVGHVALSPGGANGVLGGVGAEALEVTRLFVCPESRGLGVGGALLGRAVREGRVRAPGLVLLVSHYLGAAVAFYESSGWVRVGEKRSALSGDLLWVYRYAPTAPPVGGPL